LIRSGLWNETVSLTQSGKGIRHIFTPEEADNYNFYGKNSSFAGESINTLGTNSTAIASTTAASK
jgi:hypothetical protein